MRKRIQTTIFILCMFLLTFPAFSDIGENFEKAGIGFGGGINVNTNFYRVFDDLDERSFWYIDVFPELQIFVIDNLAIELTPTFYYETYKSDPDNIDKYMSFGLRSSFNYYWYQILTLIKDSCRESVPISVSTSSPVSMIYPEE